MPSPGMGEGIPRLVSASENSGLSLPLTDPATFGGGTIADVIPDGLEDRRAGKHCRVVSLCNAISASSFSFRDHMAHRNSRLRAKRPGRYSGNVAEPGAMPNCLGI